MFDSDSSARLVAPAAADLITLPGTGLDAVGRLDAGRAVMLKHTPLAADSLYKECIERKSPFNCG
ncbi:MAG: hypothetical protein K0U78_09340 [Actinomycetia bacterium]|nr:hypothetical protein [Actinomycetes bacterium]